MCSFSFSSNPNSLNMLEANNYYQKFRGPDYTNKIQSPSYAALHNLLHLTGKKTIQPYIYKDTLTLLNGEIYNYKRYNTDNDTKCIPRIILKYPTTFFSKLDGEFAILFFNEKTQTVIFFKDIFGTKPLFYSIHEGHIYVSSLKSALSFLPENNIIACKPNTIYTYHTISRQLNVKEVVHKFNLRQHKYTLNDFNAAILRSVHKRSKGLKSAVGLSSGIDSGCIAALLQKQKKIHFISILNNESKDILQQRSKFLETVILKRLTIRDNLKLKINSIKRCEPKKYCLYDYVNDASLTGICFIGSYCQKHKIKIFLSGTGSDEIISDYGFNGIGYFPHNSCFGGLFPSNLKKIFPWKNFFGGTMQNYIEKEEIILGAFGIETRYPFLDRDVVQEFLWLTPNLKNKGYKFPLINILKKNKFPYNEEKKGFNCNK